MRASLDKVQSSTFAPPPPLPPAIWYTYGGRGHYAAWPGGAFYRGLCSPHTYVRRIMPGSIPVESAVVLEPRVPSRGLLKRRPKGAPSLPVLARARGPECSRASRGHNLSAIQVRNDAS